MKNTDFKYKLYVIATLVIALSLAAFRTVLLLYFFDYDVNYYSAGTILPTLCNILLLIATLFAASSLFTFKKDELGTRESRASGFFVFTSSLCAFSLIGHLIFGLTKSGSTTLEKVAALAAAPAAIYFFLLLVNSEKSLKLRSIFGFFVPIWGVLNLAAIYFDSYVAINDPNKIIEQTAFISTMLFFLYELRILLEKPKPKLHLFFGLCALIFTAAASFPGIIAVSLGKLDAKYLAYDVIFAAMFLYVCRAMMTSTKEE